MCVIRTILTLWRRRRRRRRRRLLQASSRSINKMQIKKRARAVFLFICEFQFAFVTATPLSKQNFLLTKLKLPLKRFCGRQLWNIAKWFNNFKPAIRIFIADCNLYFCMWWLLVPITSFKDKPFIQIVPLKEICNALTMWQRIDKAMIWNLWNVICIYAFLSMEVYGNEYTKWSTWDYHYSASNIRNKVHGITTAVGRFANTGKLIVPSVYISGKFQMTYFYNVSSFFSFWSCRWQYSNFMSRSQLSTMLHVYNLYTLTCFFFNFSFKKEHFGLQNHRKTFIDFSKCDNVFTCKSLKKLLKWW